MGTVDKLTELQYRRSVIEQGGGEATVIAWIWARTVKCPNPACGCQMPLASSYVLSKKKDKEAWVEPIVEDKKIRFVVHQGKCPKEKESDKLGRSAVFRCPACGEAAKDAYVKKMGVSHEIGTQLMAVVAEGNRSRIYLPPDAVQEQIAQVTIPEDIPSGSMPNNPR